MGLLERYKKPGGKQQLVKLIETSAPQVKENIIFAVRREDPEFAEEVMQLVLTWEDLQNQEDMVFNEIAETVPPNMLAIAYHKEESSTRERFFKRISPVLLKKIQEVEEDFGADTAGKVKSGQMFVLKEARKLEEAGKIQLKIDRAQKAAEMQKQQKEKATNKAEEQTEQKLFAEWDKLFGK
jgi:flagellar motor switch protein FliG